MYRNKGFTGARKSLHKQVPLFFARILSFIALHLTPTVPPKTRGNLKGPLHGRLSPAPLLFHLENCSFFKTQLELQTLGILT